MTFDFDPLQPETLGLVTGESLIPLHRIFSEQGLQVYQAISKLITPNFIERAIIAHTVHTSPTHIGYEVFLREEVLFRMYSYQDRTSLTPPYLFRLHSVEIAGKLGEEEGYWRIDTRIAKLGFIFARPSIYGREIPIYSIKCPSNALNTERMIREMDKDLHARISDLLEVYSILRPISKRFSSPYIKLSWWQSMSLQEKIKKKTKMLNRYGSF